MRKTHLVATLLQFCLAVAFILLVVFQTLSFPGQFASMAKENPDMANLRWPLTAFTAIELLCITDCHCEHVEAAEPGKERSHL